MNKKNIWSLSFLSVFSFSLLLASCYVIYSRVPSAATRYILYFMVALFFLIYLLLYVYFRKRFIQFSDTVCDFTEKILNEDDNDDIYNQELLTAKMITELKKVNDVSRSKVHRFEKEKNEIQNIVSDISHQLKIPISNIQMYGDMLLDQDTEESEKENFRFVMEQQIAKMEFLVDSLNKMSRLESNIIRLSMKNDSIFQTLVLAMNSIVDKASKKNIEITVECEPHIYVSHDRKWTAEAIENILDNAVKYTPCKGSIRILVLTTEMYVEIKIKDTGKGIKPENTHEIFKRFFREQDVNQYEGLGIGLYLSRKIIELQDGYITAESRERQGAAFTVCLPLRYI